ncbi:hypothetical protein [Pseudomonas fluorescens]|uniref:hypothetical protein n=1 Tax=Pseudomonas fluorescens TaxID=294 RepID=UPI00177A771C|nr:hypothetical protein [Pseudomonas fluorescens]
MNAEATIKENLTVRFGGLGQIRSIFWVIFMASAPKLLLTLFQQPSHLIPISRLQEISLHDTLPPSLPIQRPGLVTRELSATAPPSDLQAFFYARNFELWRLCVGRLRACRIP